MYDPRPMLERQAQWQRERAKLPWPEKIRMALLLREAAQAMRKSHPPTPTRGKTPR